MTEKLKSCPFCPGEAAIVNFKPHQPEGYWQVMCRKCGIKTRYHQGKYDAVKAWNTRAGDENPPLTLEELRQMEGEPVYIIYNADGDGMWRIFHQIDDNFGADSGPGEYAKFEDGSSLEAWKYGKTWLAYRRKPEGEMNL